MIDENNIKELLRLKGDHLFHREGQELEFKEQFNFNGLADYFRDFAAFANNRGGYLIFGIKNSPRIPVGLSESSLEQFSKVDPERITGFLLEIFSSDIRWEQGVVEINNKSYGVFKINESANKPIIACKDEGREQIIKNGEIYFRYGGRTQKIQSAELESIINKRIEQNNNQWIDLMKKIGAAGPQNAAILDTKKALIEKGQSRILVMDKKLADKIKFIKDGEFNEQDGAETLKLVGDIMPVDRIEVVQRIKENILKIYPLSAMELVGEVKKALPKVNTNSIWGAILENGIKQNPDYSIYNFRNKKHEDYYNETGLIKQGTPSIYSKKAVNFLVKILQQQN